MSIVQFYRIFLARRWLILGAMISCLVGAMIVTLILPPRWEAHSRVILNTMKPDPVTGQVIGTQAGAVYAQTQIELITDPSVAGQTAEQLGWLSDPTLIAAYNQRSSGDQRDFRSWLAQLIIDNTTAKLLEQSNILDITYAGTSAANAKGVADTLRKVYIEDSLAQRRQDAERSALWYEQQAAKVKDALDKAIDAETAYEKANGVVMANDKTDVESARLQALTASGGVMPAPSVPMVASTADMELAQVDSQIAADTKVLGPNNPEMQALRSRRASLAVVAAQQKAAVRAATSGASSNVGALDRAMSAQKAKIIADSPKIGRLNQLQNEVNLLRDELQKLSDKAAQYRQESLITDSGLTPLGTASTPKAAAFPNYMLIVPGAIILGGGLGVLVAILLELLHRRVRGVEDLESLTGLPLVGVVDSRDRAKKTNAGPATRPRPRRRGRKTVPA